MKCCIDMYAGLLGAGKTTLINRLLATEYKGKKVAIIENEIGKINLDAGSFKGPDVTVRELTNGCVCCTIKGDFSRSVDEIAETVNPDCIIIEPTGAADISGIIDACSGCKHAELHRLVMVANAKKLTILLSVVGPFYIDQIKCASCIYLNFSDQVSEEKLKETIEQVEAINPSALLIATPMAEVDETTFEGKADFLQNEEKTSDGETAGENLTGNRNSGNRYEGNRNSDNRYEGNRNSDNRYEGNLYKGNTRRPTLKVMEAKKGPSRMIPSGKNKDTTIYTWTLEISGPLSEAEYQQLKQDLQDPKKGELWRVKGIVPMESGEFRRIDLTFGDYFETTQEEVSEDLVGKIVLIGKRWEKSKWLISD